MVVVIEEFAFVVAADSVRGGGWRGCDCDGDESTVKFMMGEELVEEEDPETTGADASALEAVKEDPDEEVLVDVDELCVSFPDRSVSFVILMLHIRDTIPDC